MPERLRAVVIGAGIGGLTAAAAMRKFGIEVEVFERAQELGEVGAGLQIGPNAVKVLRALGLEDALRKVAAEPTNFVSVKWDDATLRYREPLKAMCEERYGARYLMAHRADLHALLKGLVPESSIHLGTNCTGVEQRNGAAAARFANGREVEADVVIGADGIHSVVREQLWGRLEPRFTQQICWRAIVPREHVPTRVGPDGSVHLDLNEYIGWIGPNGHVIYYPIRGGSLVNIFAGRISEEWAEESWLVPSSADEMLKAYEGWNPALLDVFAKVKHCYRWGIFDRDPLAKWTAGRITLVGDAAHPMMPTLAQGAAISIEDGYTVARCLAARADDPEEALKDYDAERRPRASGVQLQARQQFENNRKVPPPPPIDRDWIYEHDATRPSAALEAAVS